jgi:hypothetical protein
MKTEKREKTSPLPNLLTRSVGEEAVKLSAIQDKHEAVEVQREILKGSNSKKSFVENVHEAAERGRNDSRIKYPFYVVVLLKKERLLQNVIRPYYLYRQSCPTPEYDQTVYKVTENNNLEYLWTIPDLNTCVYLSENEMSLTRDHQLMLHMLEAFNNGDLLKLSKKLNKEFDLVI